MIHYLVRLIPLSDALRHAVNVEGVRHARALSFLFHRLLTILYLPQQAIRLTASNFCWQVED